MKYILFFIMFSLPFFSLFSQRNMADSIIPTPLLGVQYSGSWTAADLKQRYGYMNQIGMAVGYKFQKNWYAGFSGDFMFGNRIYITRYDLFKNFVDSYFNITNENGGIATVLTFSRGFHLNGEAGKVFNQLGHNKNSGLFVKFGLGFLNHRIRIESNDDVVPLLEKEYKKGYDRLTTGLNVSQFVGYLFMANNNFLNFYVGYFIQEGFTKNRRNLFWDQPDVPVDKSTRLDILHGFKFGWLIPVYRRVPRDYYYD